ncbi:hypothetical protein CC86DRAFT_22178 [Ophiobolus disseminans]|uniref:Uncharacterized protein n=1 Tax=Ophiobolus disseminans TaxID=1469910 RepID=A0A6A7A201_9PLEO|nr:hypothetical protein CC86DRAFT_22178 [Ophiobolus disseminans]
MSYHRSLLKYIERAALALRRFVVSEPQPTASLSIGVFTRLPYDIRSIVYSYVDPGIPLVTNDLFLGFGLTCRQAKHEVEELACERLDAIRATIKNNSGVEVTLGRTTQHPRNIVVTLSYSAFENPDTSRQAKWKRAVLVGLHPLLSEHFDMLQIHLSRNGSSTSNVPAHDTLLERAQLQLIYRNILRDLGFMIDCVNWNYTPEEREEKRCLLEGKLFEQIPANVSPYPSTGVRSKRICITWDLQTSPRSDRILLNGHLRSPVSLHCQKRGPRSFRSGLKEDFFKGKSTKPDLRYCFEKGGFYSLHDKEYLVGEVGIVSPKRWRCRYNSSMAVAGLVNGVETDGLYPHEGYVSSDGLGREVRDGLTQIRVEDFEREKEEGWNFLY